MTGKGTGEQRLIKNNVTYTDNSAIDLGWVLTLHVGILQRSHLQHAHPKSIDINRFIIMLFIHFWGHKLRST